MGGWLSGGININTHTAPYSLIPTDTMLNILSILRTLYTFTSVCSKLRTTTYLLHFCPIPISGTTSRPTVPHAHQYQYWEPVTGYKCRENRWGRLSICVRLCNTVYIVYCEGTLLGRGCPSKLKGGSVMCANLRVVAAAELITAGSPPLLPLLLLTPTESQTYLSRSAGHPSA